MTLSVTIATPPALGRPWPDRFPGPAPQPLKPGNRMELRDGIRVLGFEPVERVNMISYRCIGPELEALLLLGAIDPAVTTLRLTFVAPAGPVPITLFFEDHPLVVEAAAAGATVAAAVPIAWAVQASLPPAADLPRPAWARLEIRCGAGAPGNAAAPWSGPALHVVEFLE
jgi:hypothetical protein